VENQTAGQTFLGTECYIKGEVHFAGPAQIAGKVEGQIQADDLLEIAPGALVEGDIVGSIIEIHGTVKGNVTAAQTCRLEPTARVTGELRAANLAIAEGASFAGQVHVGSATSPATQTRTPTIEPLEEPAPTRRVETPRVTLSGRIEQKAVVEEPDAAHQAAGAPAMAAASNVRVVTQNLQQALNRGSRIIKA
jgi:cytoskeletal protein CcmA (bactofilin family)